MKIVYTGILFCFFIGKIIAQNVQDGNHPNVHKIVLNEVIQTTSYTYVQGSEEGTLQWIAVPKMDAEVGETYYYHGGMEMRDFKSKELDRTFESVLFLNGLVTAETVEGGSPTLSMSSQMSVGGVQVDKQEISIDPVPGGITIAELYARKDQFAGKVVKIRGQVTKYHEGILGKNWLHLQDGSGEDEDFDLTATTDGVVRVGDVITMEGIITLDKDFGAGYFYEVIMEGGRSVTE